MVKMNKLQGELIQQKLGRAARVHKRILTSTSPTSYKNVVTQMLEESMELMEGVEECAPYLEKIVDILLLHKKVSAPGNIRYMRPDFDKVDLMLDLLNDEWGRYAFFLEKHIMASPPIGNARMMTPEEIREAYGPKPIVSVKKPVEDDSKNGLYSLDPKDLG